MTSILSSRYRRNQRQKKVTNILEKNGNPFFLRKTMFVVDFFEWKDRNVTGSNRPGLICCDRPAPVGSQQPHTLIETATSIVFKTIRSRAKISRWFYAQICVRFVCDRLSETASVVGRSLSRAKPRDQDFAIEERPKMPEDEMEKR